MDDLLKLLAELRRWRLTAKILHDENVALRGLLLAARRRRDAV